ncbi:FimV/HubP family polar landmark protein [Pseudoalteromonas sp. SSM20]|uniref:FimV/HubP family polar landmark protein n=1 Tax=Pseudoalteromonas sp. SSM20 TaxID=3139394 RepID=UPI003BAC3BAA
MRSFFSSKAIFLLSVVLLGASSISFDLNAENTRIRGPKNVDVGEQGKRYGPVRDTDTLWRIATKLRPDNSVTIYQVMQAIYQKNPDSFLDNNINHLRTGSYLRMPSMREIRSINAGFAQERSELDDKLWDKKVKGEMTQAEIDVVAKQAEQAKKQDVIVAKKELSEEIQQAKQAQTEKLEQLKDEFKSSVNNVEAILTENENLKKQVSSLSTELELIRGQLDSDRQTLDELKALLAEQHRILAAQEAKAKAEAESFSFQDLTNNPLLLVVLALIPGFLIVGGAIYWFKSRAAKNEPEEPIFDTPSPNIPDPIVNDNLADDLSDGLDDVLANGLDDPLDDELSAGLDDPFDDALDQSFDDSLEDDIVALDDSLDDALEEPDDLLYEDEEPALESSNSLLDQDELDGLLGDALDDDGSDDLVPDMNNDSADDGLLDADDIDAILAQDFDSPIDNDDESDDIAIDEMIASDSEIELDIPEEFEPSNEIESDVADVDAIMDELSNDEFDLDDSLSDDLEPEEKEPEIQLDMDDIDAMIDEVEADDTDLTDLDALLEEANSDAERLAAQQAAAEAFANTDTSEQDLEESIDINDSENAQDTSYAIGSDDAEDDIDALLDEAAGNEEVNEADDIDSLLDEAAISEEAESELAAAEIEQDELEPDTAVDDIDALLDEATDVEEVNDVSDSLDEDDLLDSTLEDTDLEAELLESELATAEIEQDELEPETAVDDIDALLDESTDVEEVSDSLDEEDLLDSALEDINAETEVAESELATAEIEQDELEPETAVDDIDALLDEAADVEEVNDVNDSFDEDDLLDSALEDTDLEAELPESELVNAEIEQDQLEPETAVDDIDALLDETTDVVEVNEVSDSFDEDDFLDSALEDTDLEAELLESELANAEIEQDELEPETAVDDIDALLDETTDVEEVNDVNDSLDEDDSLATLESDFTEELIDVDGIDTTDDAALLDSLLDDENDISSDGTTETDLQNLASEESAIPSLDNFDEQTQAHDEITALPEEQDIELDNVGDDLLNEFDEIEEPQLTEANDDALLQADELLDDISLPDEQQQDVTADSLGLSDDDLDSAFDEQLLSEDSIDFGDDPLIDVDLEAEDERLSDAFDNDEQMRADAPSQTLDEYPELELDEALEEIDAPAFGAEESLPEIKDAQAINEEVITTEDLSASDEDDFLDDDIIGSDLDNSNDLLIDELESTDFDSLLNELAEPEPITAESQKDFELDFDSLLSEQTEAEPFEVEEIDTAESDYLDIDDLLEESDDAESDVEPYQNVDMDVGLGDFEDLLAGEDALDVDMESQGYSAKLDLARAYLEINDAESALKVIEEVISNGPPEVQDEALALKHQLS